MTIWIRCSLLDGHDPRDPRISPAYADFDRFPRRVLIVTAAYDPSLAILSQPWLHLSIRSEITIRPEFSLSRAAKFYPRDPRISPAYADFDRFPRRVLIVTAAYDSLAVEPVLSLPIRTSLL
jgi:acetyl esterase/lipase